MKAEWTLACAYIKRHKKQFATSAVCVAIFAAAICGLQLFLSAYNDWKSDELHRVYGFYESAYVDVNPEAAKASTPPAPVHAAVYVTGQVDLPAAIPQTRPCVGYWTGDAPYLLNTTVLEGRLPQEKGEAALAQNAYDVLGLDAKVGDTFTLQVLDADGHAQAVTYRLCGILSPYRDTWSKFIGTGNDRDFLVPDILTAPSNAPVLVAHILMGDDKDNYAAGINTYSGSYNQNGILLDRNMDDIQAQFILISTLMVLLLTGLTVLGIRHVAQITLKEQRKFLGLLRCLGATRGQAARTLLLHGALLGICALGVGVLLGVGLFYAITAALNQFTYTLSYRLALFPFLSTFLLGMAVILVTYWLQIRKALRTGLLGFQTAGGEAPKKEKRGKDTSFVRLWRRATRRANRAQNWMVLMMASFCMLLIVFTPFYAELTVQSNYSYDDLELSQTGMDHWFGLRNGSGDIGLLGQEHPRYKGVRAASYQELTQNPNLRMDYAEIGPMSSARILDVPGAQQPPAIENIRKGGSFRTSGDQTQRDQAMRAAGYPDDADLLWYAIRGIPYDQLAAFAPHLRAGTIDADAYGQGRQVAAFGSDFSVGDRVTISIAAYPMSEGDDTGTPVITNVEVEVGAVYHIEHADSLAAQRVLRNGSSFLAFSAEAMQAIDPGAGFDDVCLSLNCDPGDAQAMASVAETLRKVNSQSFLTYYRDFTQLHQEKMDLSMQLKLPYLVMIAIFVAAIFIALAISMNLKVKSGVRSFALLRAIGMDQKQLSKLLLLDNLLPCMAGAGAGLVLGVALSLLFSLWMSYGVAGLFLQTVLPCAVAGLVLLALLCVLSYLQPRKWLLNQPVVESIDSVLY